MLLTIAKLQWLQDLSEISGYNLNNIRRETSRHFRNKKRGKGGTRGDRWNGQYIHK
jgi:hypothetical protein